MKTLKTLQQEKPKEFAIIETKWGNYPVLAIKDIVNNKRIFSAWVGLNDPQSGWTLVFNLVYPNKENHPNNNDRQIWKNLLTKTTLLKDGDYFKACGQDLQEGYTLISVGGVKLKMIAEKRQSDGMLQVVVLPESSEVEIRYHDMMDCLMGAKWKYGEPIVKVYSEITVGNNKYKVISSNVTTIFYKTVSEFSYKKDDSNKLLIFQKISNKTN